jgi:hypothetical protein
MKRWKALVLPLACVLSVGVAACGDNPSGDKSSADKSSRGSEGAHVAKFKIGHGIGRDGEVTREGRTFEKGEKAYVSFVIANATPAAQARVLWVAKPGGAKMAEETKPLTGRGGVVSFAAETTSWDIGTYSLEIFAVESGQNGVRRLGTADLSVAASRPK